MTLIFGFLEENIEKIIESRYIGIFLIIGKIIDIDMKFLNLSVIWRNYRQNYRYRNWLEIYRKIIDIEKNDLSPTPSPKGEDIIELDLPINIKETTFLLITLVVDNLG